MPAINKIRFTNVIFEDGNKRYNDELFLFNGFNGAILLENGGGKTVFIQTALQAVLPHTDLANRKMKHTLRLEGAPAHIAIEWILNERPRRYAVTCVNLFLTNNSLDSYRYVYEYEEGDADAIERIPFVKGEGVQKRPAGKGEIQDYYQAMLQRSLKAKTFQRIYEYKDYLEDNYQIVSDEWESIVKINSSEGGVEEFFDECKQTGQLFDRLLIPAVEQSISGYKETDFADTFEKHRENFKEYKALKEKIAENERIEAAIDTYAATFAHLHENEQQYREIRGWAKAVMNQIRIEQERLSDEERLHESSMQEWQNSERSFQIKEASYNIARQREKTAAVRQTFEDIQVQCSTMEEKRKQVSRQYQSLKLAKYKKLANDEKTRFDYYEQELAIIEEQQDIEEIQTQFTEKQQEILGYFLQEIEKYEKKRRAIQYAYEPLASHHEALADELQKLMKGREQLEKEFERKEGSAGRLRGQLDQIKRSILSNPDKESVKERQEIWLSEQEALDHDVIAYENENKSMRIEVTSLKEQIEAQQDEVAANQQKQWALKNKLEQIHQEEAKLKQHLRVLKPVWSNLESVYLRQDSLYEQLRQTLSRLKREREDLLKQERLASRFADDYGEQTTFFVDAGVQSQMERWKNQFSLLETGVEYVQAHGLEQEQWVQNYRLWPITLITTEQEKELLADKIKTLKERIQFPFVILTTKAVRELKAGAISSNLWIAPLHWQRALSKGAFQDWKTEMLCIAQESSQARTEKEAELHIWERASALFTAFFEQYPYDVMQQIKNDQAEMDTLISNILVKISVTRKKVEELEKTILLQEKLQKEARDKWYGLDSLIREANRYLGLARELQEIEALQQDISHRLRNVEKDIQLKQRVMESTAEQKKALQEDIAEQQYAIKLLQDDKHYQKVKNFTPIYSEKSREVLEEEHNRLWLSLHQVSETRNEMMVKRESAKKGFAHYKGLIAQLNREYDHLNEEMEFPITGNEQLERLLEQEKTLKAAYERLLYERDEKQKQFYLQEVQLKTLERSFAEAFPEEKVMLFTDPLLLVSAQLKERKQALAKKRQHLMEERERIARDITSMNKAYQMLDRHEELHKFQAASLPMGVLSTDEVLAFTYERNQMIERVIDDLKNSYEAVEKEKIALDHAKSIYYDFCRNSIKDVRMMEMAINGVQTKKTYKEVIHFKEQMKNRTNQSTKIAEETMRSHDKQLEQFVTHIHAHLMLIVQELALIPKQTRVKIGNQLKQIYRFTLPVWEEENGKERIRVHIDWILEQLKQDKYKDEENKEDEARIRKDLERWLHSKQLLRVVMNSEVMKVSCHKVTNDNQVSRRSYSWEESNDWSGGEKWSKNMTLFLGLLNYAAEKKQHIRTNMLTHKAVILDNPFGKASSDHVLSPVFFIAEQLGFQIIALTAHAEGKFLRDYFPVIYSCRLRQASEHGKQIMTKEKWVHQAYFQDHDPIALNRLGEHEQLTLFE